MPMFTEQFLKHQEIDVSAPHALTQSQSLIRPGCRPSDNGANCWHSGRRSSSEPRWVGFATWSRYGSWGTIALAFATWVCFRLDLNFATTAFVYLIFIVLLSLMDSFISSAVFSALAVTGLVRRVSRLGKEHGEQGLLLDLTRDSVFARNVKDVITYWNRGA